MSPLNSLILAAVVWVLLHLGVSGTALRTRIVDAIGAGPFRIVFSLVSVAVIYWLASSYGKAGAVRVLWTSPHWLIVVCMLSLLPALLLLVGSVTVPNPTMVGGKRALATNDAARGILRVVRHPMLWAFAIWAAAHLVMFGTLGGVVFFGSFLVVALAGMPSLDAKIGKRNSQGWAKFVQATSNIPFAAIAQGRNRFVFAEIGIWRIAIAVLAWFGLIALHPLVYGVPAWRMLVGG
jgi:uncharacterized membrane protein